MLTYTRIGLCLPNASKIQLCKTLQILFLRSFSETLSTKETIGTSTGKSVKVVSQGMKVVRQGMKIVTQGMMWFGK